VCPGRAAWPIWYLSVNLDQSHRRAARATRSSPAGPPLDRELPSIKERLEKTPISTGNCLRRRDQNKPKRRTPNEHPGHGRRDLFPVSCSLGMKIETHQLPSFSIGQQGIRSARSRQPDVGCAHRSGNLSASVFLALFHAFVFRRRAFSSWISNWSFHLPHWIGAERSFHTTPCATAGFDLEPLERC